MGREGKGKERKGRKNSRICMYMLHHSVPFRASLNRSIGRVEIISRRGYKEDMCLKRKGFLSCLLVFSHARARS